MIQQALRNDKQENSMSIVRTYTGRDLDLANPDPAQIDIRDIAHHLSKLDR